VGKKSGLESDPGETPPEIGQMVLSGGEEIMSKKKRIVIADDHTILREGLKAILSSDPELEVVGEAADGQEAILGVEKLKPDLVLMDLSMPGMNGMDAIKEIKKRWPETKILVLTVHKSDEYIQAALQAGADGYALKDCTNPELRIAIKKVSGGKVFISPGVSGKLIAGNLENKGPLKLSIPWETVTSRQKEILKLIAAGHKNKEIAHLLGISVKTVEKHRVNLMQKLDLHSAPALTALAVEKGLISK
jgi:two-component system response regulator NreC